MIIFEIQPIHKMFSKVIHYSIGNITKIKLFFTLVRGITCSAYARYRKAMSSMLSRGKPIVPDARYSALMFGTRTRPLCSRSAPTASQLKMLKCIPSANCQMCDMNCTSRVNALARIYWMGLQTSAAQGAWVPCCGQDGYCAQVLQHPIDIKITFRYISHFFLLMLQPCNHVFLTIVKVC